MPDQDPSNPEARTPGIPTSGPHVFVPPIGTASDVLIEGDSAHHLRSVIRVRRGDFLSLADDSGAVWQGTVADLTAGAVHVALQERFEIVGGLPKVTVIQSLPKGRKMDEVITRLSEVGVDRIIPVHSARSVKQVTGLKADKVMARWRALALAAAQQSRRPRLLRVEGLQPWPVPGVEGVILYERATVPLSAVVGGFSAAADVALAVGPEGGWEPTEVEESGLAPVALGHGILRAETAGLVGASVLLHKLGRLG